MQKNTQMQESICVFFVYYLFLNTDHIGKSGSKFLNGHAGSIDHQIIVLCIQPLLSCKELIIVGTLVVNIVNMTGKLLVSERFFVCRRLGAAALHSGRHIRIHKNAEGL